MNQQIRNRNKQFKKRINQINRDIVPEGYKKSDAGIIPKDWTVKKLSDISLGNSGKYGINAAAVNYNKDLPRYLRITDISETGTVRKNNYKSVNHQDSINFHLEEGDIVFARTGSTTGKTYLYDKEDGRLVYAGFLIKYSIDPEQADSRLIFYNTQTQKYWNWVGVMSIRSGQPGINSKEYSELTLPLPQLFEQKKIVDLLNTWDRALELKELLIENKINQQIGLLKKMLTQNFNWISYNLGDVLFEPEKKKVEEPWNIELLTVRLHNKGVIKSGNYPNKTKNARPYFKRSYGELLIGRQNMHNGGIGIVKKEQDGLICSNAITSLLNKEHIDLQYVYYYLSNPNFYRKVEFLIGGTGQKEISKKELLNLTIFVPDYSSQKYITQILSTADKEIKLLKREVSALKEQKKGLMQLLLTGIIRIGGDNHA